MRAAASAYSAYSAASAAAAAAAAVVVVKHAVVFSLALARRDATTHCSYSEASRR